MTLKPPGGVNTPLLDNDAGFLTVGGFSADGTSDNSSAVQTWLDRAGDIGGILHFPGGTYLAEGLEVPTGVTVQLGAGASLKHAPSSTTYCIQLTGDDASIIGGSIDGNSPNIAAAVNTVEVVGTRAKLDGLNIWDAQGSAVNVLGADLLVDCCKIRAVNAATSSGTGNHAIQLSLNPTLASDVIIRGTTVDDAGLGSIGGRAHRLIVIDCILRDAVGGDGIAVYPNVDGGGTGHVVAVGNIIENPGNNGMHLGGVKGATVSGNRISDATERGIVLWMSDPANNAVEVASENYLVQGNLVKSCGNDGIELRLVTAAAITNNVVRDNAGTGIAIASTGAGNGDVTIAGNVCRNNVTHGVSVGSSTRVSVTGNLLVDNDQRGLAISGTAADVTATGNTITGNAVSGVRTQDTASRVQFSGNIVRDNASLNFDRVATTEATNRFVNNLTDDPGVVAMTTASITVTRSSADHVIQSGNIAGNRTVTLPTNDFTGRKFRVTRAAAGDAFTVGVGTGPLKAVAQGQWCEVVYDGSAWVLTAFGSL